MEQALRRESDRNHQEDKAQAEYDRPAASDRYAEQTEHVTDCGEIVTTYKTDACLPKATPDGTAPSGISLSPEMFAPAGDDRVSSASRETGVLSEICDLPRRAYAGVSDAVAKAGSWLGDIQGPLLFAQASPPDPAASGEGSAQMKLLALNETAAHDFFTGFIGGDDGRFMADEIGKVTAGKELVLTSIPQSRIAKRAALADLEAWDAAVYHEYLQNNCHIRTKTVNGHPIGDGLLVAGEYARNPWRGMSEALADALTPGRKLNENEVLATEYFNIGSDIGLAFITAGLYPIIKYGTAKSLSIAGQAANGDKTCLKREFSAEEMARLLFDTEVGITSHQPVSLVRHKPAEVAGAAKFKPSGLFVEQHLPSGIHMEKYMAIRKDGAEVLIREKAPGEFVTYHLHATDPVQSEQRVFFDPESQRIFFSKDFAHDHGYDFNIVEGRKFVEVQGGQFELHYNRDKQQLEVKVEQGDVTSQLPVYKKKLSHTWHLGVHNNHPVFTDWQKTLIDRMKINLDATRVVSPIDNLNPAAYGNGKIYEVRKAGAVPADAADLHVIEMHGELIPVRMQVVEGHGVRYEAYTIGRSKSSGRPVEWDGQRWIFEKNTSVHVAPALKKAIDESMFDGKISSRDLSAPDQRGIQWDRLNRGFLKIKGGFVRVKKLGNNPDAWYMAHAGKKTNLFFHNDRFIPENFRHRLQRLNKEGMSGRGAVQAQGRPGQARERTAAEIVQDCFGGTREQAAEYLRQFHFEPNGLHNEREFALFLEQYDAVPHWARRIGADNAASVADPGAFAPPAGPAAPTGSRINLGEQIGDGAEGTVYLDAMDNSYVIKRLEDRYFSPDEDGHLFDFDISLSTRHASANRDVALFNRYYGEGMAETIIEDGQVYIRMPKVPGKELRLIAKGEIPEDGVERYVDMLERLSDVGIWHGDLHARNIMFDPDSKMFYPIDFSNLREHYLTAGQGERTGLNFVGESQWAWNVAAIRARMNMAGPSRP